MTKEYNGHKNWNHWNVSLWISNDEGLYNLAKGCVKASRTLDDAARSFVEAIQSDAPDWTHAHTPDGAKYTYTAVRAALRDL